MIERLQKVLAAAGVGSRRACETLITEGRVTVNGAVVRTLGAKADLDVDTIAVDGAEVKAAPAFAYIALHKPAGVVTSAADERGRRTVLDVIGNVGVRVFPVGRLDRDSEGLLLLTNDGDLSNLLLHPRNAIDKEYFALVLNVPPQNLLEQLARGIEIDGQRTAPATVDLTPPPTALRSVGRGVWVRVVIHEGRKRQVRRMFAAIGHPAIRLVRTRFGPIKLGGLKPGQSRSLSQGEVAVLRRASKGPGGPTQGGRPRSVSTRVISQDR